MKSGNARPYSQLTFRQTEPQPGAAGNGGDLITLHGHMKPLNDLNPLAKEIAPDMRIVAPEAARGVYRSIQMIGKTWFGGSLKHPDPASFGDSLSQLERFIYDVQNRAGTGAPKPWLLGYEQGAVLASTIALIAPDLVSGIIALGGGLPSFSNEALLEPMNGNLPVLFIGDSKEEEHSSYIKTSAAQLEKLGNDVTVQFLQLSTGANSAAAQAAKAFLDGKR